jgi:hypothetical protein
MPSADLQVYRDDRVESDYELQRKQLEQNSIALKYMKAQMAGNERLENPMGKKASQLSS